MTTEKDSVKGEGEGCPVDHSKFRSGSNPLASWFSSQNKDGNKKESSFLTMTSASCPIDKEGAVQPPRLASIPASIENHARHSQKPHPTQRVPLNTHRVVSSIARASDEADDGPIHQPPESSHWVYPSEQQFYNAMRRKGWEADESTIPLVVRIHNAVNERGWTEVKKWEALHGCTNPRLVRFLGRPQDMSPKAFMNTYLLGYNAPFDRHDWYVDRCDGSLPRRYVIDFYNGNDVYGSSNGNKSLISTLLGRLSRNPGGSNSPESDRMNVPSAKPSMYLDVRPALDRPDAFLDRAQMFVRDALPGIFAAFPEQSNEALRGNQMTSPPNNGASKQKTSDT